MTRECPRPRDAGVPRVQITRAGAGFPFDPTADHHGVQPMRLHGGDAGPTERLIATRSHFAAGAWVDPGPMTGETLYVLLAGELTIEMAGHEPNVLGTGDSVYLPKGTMRAFRAGNVGATLLVVRNP